MARRSKKFYVFTGLLGVIVVYALLVTFKTGPITGPLNTVDDLELARADAVPGVQCEDWIVPVKLTADAWFSHDVAGTLCHTSQIDGRTLAVTVSGAGYDSLYWDFPYEPETYSFTRAALKRGLRRIQFRPARHGPQRPAVRHAARRRQPGLRAGADHRRAACRAPVRGCRDAGPFVRLDDLARPRAGPARQCRRYRADRFRAQLESRFQPRDARRRRPRRAIEGTVRRRRCSIRPTCCRSADSRGDIFYTLDNVDPERRAHRRGQPADDGDR